jgi:hypothetical protein
MDYTTEKIHCMQYMAKLKFTEKNKLLFQKSYDAGHKICGLYLAHYIPNNVEKLKWLIDLLVSDEITTETDVININDYIREIQAKIYFEKIGKCRKPKQPIEAYLIVN